MEELKNINISALGNGRPADTLTDKKWQNEFEILNNSVRNPISFS